ncbi:uncharacterized protein LOC106161718 [Lingula anatina]|uniref:Uncharacterized protein LOC106161718 n=1 Tax=Lingula anatina TaxID=7574 RepID=A0A1S3I7M4_LINAN|nr:uncharacterized protein LOC106161718 [Lingula anatina]|eukprot:XP_013394198.1 uncharacterized protein LOC106161718 [Lingula anatina]
MANSKFLLLYFLIAQSQYRSSHASLVPRSCEDVLRHFGGGAFSEGVYTIDPDGPGEQPPFQVTCTTSKDLPGHGITLVTHEAASSQPKRFHATGIQVITVGFTYKPTLPQLESLIKVSGNCRQYVQILCNHAYQFYEPNWWVSRQGWAMSNWGGAPTNSSMCACAEQGRCDDPKKPCNCLINDAIWRSDEGYLEDKRYLPVKQVYVRDTNNDIESASLTVKGMECYGEINQGHPTERCRCRLHAEENSTTPGPLLLQLPDIIYGQGQDDVWLADDDQTLKITDIYPQFFNTKKRRQILPTTQVTPGLSPQCANVLQRCPVDCERLAKLRLANTTLTDDIHVNGEKKMLGQFMCENAAVNIAPPGRRIVAFFKVAPSCGSAQSSTYAFPDKTVVCCKMFTFSGQHLKVFDAQCSGNVDLSSIFG